MSCSTNASPAVNHSGSQSCSFAFGAMPSASITGSHAHTTVVTPASFIWATMFDAWFGIELISSL